MSDKKQGIVYVLTNPAMPEIVKIGMTSNSVDIRRKSLDTTGVPLPFEVYAILETSQYVKAEKCIHHILDCLTDYRVRPNREFFNMSASKATELFGNSY